MARSLMGSGKRVRVFDLRATSIDEASEWLVDNLAPLFPQRALRINPQACAALPLRKLHRQRCGFRAMRIAPAFA